MIRPATAVWGGLIVAALTADVLLVRAGHAPLTAVARTPAGRAGRVLLEAHFTGLLPARYDPFHLAGRLVDIRPRIP